MPAAAAPPAPAAKPTAPAPAPKAPVAPPPEKPPESFMDDVGRELDELSEEGAKIRPAPAASAKPKAKDDEAPPEESPAEPKTPVPVEDKIPVKTPELRAAYTDLKKKVKEHYEPEVARLTAKVKELESAPAPDLKPMEEKLSAIQKRNEELERSIEFVDYQKSKKFQETWQPYEQAWKRALADLKELSVELPDGSTRPATNEDLVKLSQLNIGEARKAANAMFGDSADDVMAHYRKCRELADAHNAAVEKARDDAVEYTKQRNEMAKSHATETAKLWSESTAKIEAASPKWNETVKNDPDLSKALDSGKAMAEKLFAPTEETRPKTVREQVDFHAQIYNIVKNHKPLMAYLKRIRQELNQTKEALAQFEASSPKGGQGRGPKTTPPTDDWKSEIDALDKQ